MPRVISQQEVGYPDDVIPMDTVKSDTVDNLGDSNIGVGLRANTAGVVMVNTLEGSAPRAVPLGAGESVGLLFTRVRASGTSATGVFAYTVKLKDD